MFKKLIIFGFTVFVSSLFLNTIYAQADNKLIQSDVIEVKQRQPTNFDTGRNFVNNKSKKNKVRSKVKQAYSISGSGYLAYHSNAKAKREKKLRRNRRK